MIKIRPAKGYEETREYFLQLGRFIHQFSGVEANLQETLAAFAGVTPETARALFSGIRTSDAIDRIRKIHKSNELPMHAALDASVKQLGIIAITRNMIVHHGTEFDDGIPSHVTNFRTAITISSVQYVPVSTEIIFQMSLDLQSISWHIGISSLRARMSVQEWQSTFENQPVPQWRYIPPNK